MGIGMSIVFLVSFLKLILFCQGIPYPDAADCAIDPHGASFTWDNTRYRVNLPGDYQVTNALLALNALRAANAGFNDRRAVARGIEDAWLPGRFQVLAVRKRIVVFDVGHNPDAAMAFCRSLQRAFKGRSVCCVLGIMKDKDIAGMMTYYTAVAGRLICTAPATERAAGPEHLKSHVPDTFEGVCEVAGTVASAVETAFKSPEEIICIAGSFFTVGEVMVCLNIHPYKK